MGPLYGVLRTRRREGVTRHPEPSVHSLVRVLLSSFYINPMNAAPRRSIRCSIDAGQMTSIFTYGAGEMQANCQSDLKVLVRDVLE